MIIDKKALKILMKAFWHPEGWRNDDGEIISEDEFQYAKNAGFMFDSIQYDHDELINKIFEIKEKIELIDVSRSFLASLSTRRLDLRSALGSFSLIRKLPYHKINKNVSRCEICGIYKDKNKIDLSVYNFERFKWGGVRHDDLDYALFDLEQFIKLEKFTPTIDDIAIFNRLIKIIDNIDNNVTSSKLQSFIKGLFKSNKEEREIFIGILGMCNILSTDNHSGYLFDFVPSSQRELPSRRFVDMHYPACWWRGSDGINKIALDLVFGEMI